MHTIRLNISDKIYDQFTWLLSKFSKDEVEVISENAEFSKTQAYLEVELQEILDGKAKFINIDELDLRLENAIKKHEVLH